MKIRLVRYKFGRISEEFDVNDDWTKIKGQRFDDPIFKEIYNKWDELLMVEHAWNDFMYMDDVDDEGKSVSTNQMINFIDTAQRIFGIMTPGIFDGLETNSRPDVYAEIIH